MTVSKCFKALYGFCTEIHDDLMRDDCAVDLSPKASAKLIQMLGEDYYTYMVLHDGLCHEIVRLSYEAGMFFIDRGQDGTDAQRWACGTLLKFDWTPSAMHEAKAYVEMEPPECPEELFSGEIKNGNCTVLFKDGIAQRERVNKHPLVNGCYENPVITLQDGCIVDMAEGCRRHLPPPSCCG